MSTNRISFKAIKLPPAPDSNDERWLDDRLNYNSDLDGLLVTDLFLNKLQKSEFLNELVLPLFLYTESRGEQNKLNAVSLHWKSGQLKMIEYTSHRFLLEDSGYFKKLVTEQVTHKNKLIILRGLALHLTTQIEYIIEVMCCIVLDGYASRETENLTRILLDYKGTYTSFGGRIELLKSKKYIPNSIDFIRMVKSIRNELAHSFFPEYIVPRQWIWEGESEIDALLRIYENTWFYLLKDLGLHQDKLILMLNTRLRNK